MIYCIIAVFLAGIILSLPKHALASCRKAKLNLLAGKGQKKYTLALKITERVHHYQTALQACIVILGIIFGCLLGVYFYNMFESRLTQRITAIFANNGYYMDPGILLYELIFIALSGVVFFLLTEIIPGAIAQKAPEKITAFFARFIIVVSWINLPLLAMESGIRALMGKIMPGGPERITEDELHIALVEGEKSGIVESKERTMVEGVFYLGDRPVGAFMTHRSETEWLDIDSGPEKIRSIMDSEQQYFPVAEGNLDKVRGIVTIRELLKALLQNKWPGLRALMRQPCFIPETMPALKSFETFKKAEINCLFVMDEYGGFSGILTVRNLIEEIVGQLYAGSSEDEAIVKQEDGTWLMDGSVNMDDAAKALSLASLDTEENRSEYHTLAGFILNLAGEIPKTGAHFDYNGYRFIIVDMDGNRIDKIMVKTINPPIE